jgi:DNA-binding PadR family transcriptional regulator
MVDAGAERAVIGALRGRDLSGFDIWRWLGGESPVSGPLTEPDLYPTLYRLEADGLLHSDWHEGERTRRQYRLTPRAIDRADRNNWPVVPFRSDGSSSTEAGTPADRRAISPDPDSGAWFVPPRTEPAALGGPAHAASSSGSDAATAPEVGPGAAAISHYADELHAALDLPAVERARVRQEIADHLIDSSRALVAPDLEPGPASNAAVARLGSATSLAVAIDRAQQSEGRQDRGRLGGALIVVSEMLVWMLVSVAVVVVTSGLADAVVGLFLLTGRHVVVLRPGEWVSSQIALMLAVGAFSAGRLSLSFLARKSRHRNESVRNGWAIGGGAALCALPLLMPFYGDALTLALMLAIPIAFVAGAFRDQHGDEAVITVRGVAIAAALLMAVVFLPGLRMLTYDPNSTPGLPLASGSGAGALSWIQQADGTYGYVVSRGPQAGTVTVELWPASRSGLSIVVDGSATRPAIADALKLSIDVDKLPPYEQWWVVAVATQPDGTRVALDVEIQTGTSAQFGNLLSRLIGLL